MPYYVRREYLRHFAPASNPEQFGLTTCALVPPSCSQSKRWRNLPTTTAKGMSVF